MIGLIQRVAHASVTIAAEGEGYACQRGSDGADVRAEMVWEMMRKRSVDANDLRR